MAFACRRDTTSWNDNNSRYDLLTHISPFLSLSLSRRKKTSFFTMAPRRIYNQSFNSGDNSYSNNGRTVTVGANVGLNERYVNIGKLLYEHEGLRDLSIYRFSQLQKAKPQEPSGRLSSQPGRGSVFARIRGGAAVAAPGNSSSNRRRNDIQSRLSKPVKAGIRKRSGPTPMQGVERTSGRLARHGKPKYGGDQASKGGARGNTGNKGKRPARGGAKGKSTRTSLSTTDLDKALDDYMMKDPKVAQSKLDAELTEYMDDSGDVLMDL
ncbi:hypothetical protein BX666DRAFT_1621363 [Dichotomocladium elegans]|nr:hypothetical protein BX666DRAFT_1621363 [Dichotomocladium elegans]